MAAAGVAAAGKGGEHGQRRGYLVAQPADSRLPDDARDAPASEAR